MAIVTRPTAHSTSSVSFDGGETFGGFSDVSGIGTEITVAEYRNGNEKENHVRKVPGVHKVGDVTLKRGIVDSKSLWDWIKETRTERRRRQKKSVTITLHDEAQTKVQSAGCSRGVDPDEVHRADAGGEGRRRRRDGRARARRPRRSRSRRNDAAGRVRCTV